jgi:CheY-like chemotaxis protein
MAHVLVVDDDLGMREWLAEILEVAGHHVSQAQDGLEAKSLAMRNVFDLVITDISMPKEEVLGTICALRKSLPDIKIIALSGKDPEALMDAKLLGAQAALRKPVTSQALLECVGGLASLRG